MKSKWRQISIDEERKATFLDNYDQFQKLLKTVPLDNSQKDFFPRTETNTPSTSYGVILVYDKREEDPSQKEIEYFCVQRRMTIEFAEIVKCGPRQKNLFEYFSCMTPHERHLLQTVPHKNLWKDVLLDEHNMFNETAKKIEAIYECYGNTFYDLIDLTRTNNDEPPWEFPKGRPYHTDRSQLHTACRECEEEATIKLKDIILLYNETISDIYRGTDGQLYETVYFVIKAQEHYEPPPSYSDLNCVGDTILSKDMSNYAWVALPTSGPVKKGLTPLGDRLEKLLYRLHKKLI
jgi:8-oxo-dGTP pyrophosphatase MutT (NUDIX family)